MSRTKQARAKGSTHPPPSLPGRGRLRRIYIPAASRREAQTEKSVKGKPPTAALRALDGFPRLYWIKRGDGEYIS